MENNSIYSQFIERVDELMPRERLELKHAVGKRLNDAESASIIVFYKILPKVISKQEEEIWFFTACLQSLWEVDENVKMTMQDAVVDYLPRASDSFLDRVMNLLDTRMEDDGFLLTKVYRMVRLLKQQGYCIDMADLLNALLHWNSDSRWVQKQWARVIATIN